MNEFSNCILVPKERIAVLIGKKGEVKREIQKKGHVTIEIESESGEVTVTRKSDADPVLAMDAIDIIKAIAHGFAPQKAYKLWSPNIYLEVINLPDFLNDSPKSLARVRARVIGREGKVRRYVSKLTVTDIVIYEKTVGILGESENVGLAKDAVLKIIDGLPHNVVFKFLESRKM